MWPALAAAAVTCAANVVAGWLLGYRDLSAYLAFWSLSALAAVTGWNVASRAFEFVDLPDACIRLGVTAVGTVVLAGLVLGASAQLTVGAYLIVEAALVCASLLLGTPSRPWPPLGRPAAPAFVAGVVGALLAFAVAFAATHSPLTLYDSLSYHLFFPARWLQDRVLSIVPTPFSDPAQAYAPANGELVFLWLMLPFHADLVARIGQLPFALLSAATLYAIGRRAGAPRQHAIYPAAFFLLARPIVEQAIGANVDLVCAALFLTSVYLGIVAVERNDRRDWMFWGVSVGLYAGSKYVALVYTPVLLLLVFARGPRVRALWALPGIAAFALPWYARNWIVAGSPIYPASLVVAGFTLARGAFGRAAMLNTVFHTADVRLFPAMAAHAVGPTLFLVWIPLVLVGAAAMARRGWWPHAFLVLVPVLMVPLYWFGFPVNIDSRFLMPALAPALLPLAFAFRNSRWWNRCLHGVYALGMVWILVGAHREIPATLPWFMGGWLAVNGLLTSAFVPWFGAVAVLVGVTWWLSGRLDRWAVPLTVSVCAASAIVLFAGGERWCPPSRCEYLDVTSPYIRVNLVYGWRWVADHVTRSTIAYTGINLPYPLTGDHLTNRVVYVNIDGHLRWRFHDYDRAYRSGRFEPVPPRLAESSGELMPVADRSGPRDDAARPRYERMEGFRDGWVHNLQLLGVRYLFVSALSAYEIDYVWHNAGGFPVEDEWARQDPRCFQLMYENPQVRIYAIDARARDGA